MRQVETQERIISAEERLYRATRQKETQAYDAAFDQEQSEDADLRTCHEAGLRALEHHRRKVT
jgi:hypothetical protein